MWLIHKEVGQSSKLSPLAIVTCGAMQYVVCCYCFLFFKFPILKTSILATAVAVVALVVCMIGGLADSLKHDAWRSALLPA